MRAVREFLRSWGIRRIGRIGMHKEDGEKASCLSRCSSLSSLSSPIRLIRPIPPDPPHPPHPPYPPHALPKTIRYTVESHVSLARDVRHGRRVGHRRVGRTAGIAERAADDAGFHAALRLGRHVLAPGIGMAVDGRYVDGHRRCCHAASGGAGRMHRAWSLHVHRGRGASQFHPRRRQLPAATDDPGWQPLAAAGQPQIRRRRGASSARGGRAVRAAASPLPLGRRWPSFRGHEASGVADGQNSAGSLGAPKPARTFSGGRRFPGSRTRVRSSGAIGSSSPRAISSAANATFKPGLYGDGDASDDRSPQRWVIYAIDKRTGKIAGSGSRAKASRATSGTSSPRMRAPRRPPTGASSSPGSARRVSTPTTSTADAMAGGSRPRRHGGLRHSVVRMGAGELADHLERPGHRPVRHADRFVPAGARCRDRRDGVEDAIARSCRRGASPTVVTTPAGPELVTNASNFIRGYDPRTGRELWRLGGSSKITAPTPIFADGLLVVASGRAPERPMFAVRPGARGDLTLAEGRDRAARGRLEQDRPRIVHADAARLSRDCSTCSPTTACSMRTTSQTGKEIYRQRLPNIGSGLQRVAGGGRRQDLSVERGRRHDGRSRPGATFTHVAANPMGETADGDAGALGGRDVRPRRLHASGHQPPMSATRTLVNL